ncbi:uncharacterized protein LOC127358934 isoform X2 [Dicentrarchus labrax]|uniref:uncharacterized protein LOC127358934 isoform X2 n=1 Tax=Dicentrarchus labrax TaxID=13489 RepID=UPI0021F57A71|nr:uncharacterized protein LOC127358934 isoform X2 [Dicentrarchus labrax]
MDAETNDSKKTFFRKPDCTLWTATCVVITYAVWCVLLFILTASGQLSNSQRFECGNSKEDLVASGLKNEATLVYLWSGLSLPGCFLLLLEMWRRKGHYGKMLLGVTLVLVVTMSVSLDRFQEKERQEMESFERRYLDLLPLTDIAENKQKQLTNPTCRILNNVYNWQAEFKCCGLRGYQDWLSPLPDSCLCDREDNSSGCVRVQSSLVYEKPCLPTVLSLVGKRSSTFWTIMIVWEIYEPCCYKLNFCIYKMRGGEDMAPVVFIRRNNNNQTEEEEGKDREAKENGRDDGVALDIGGGTNVEREGQESLKEDWDDNPVRMIPLSVLTKLQEELDPPPVEHKVRCMCISPSKPRSFYTILIEEGSPLLPSYAVLVDPNKPTRNCLWAEGPHVFVVEHLVWPSKTELEVTSPLL